MTKLSSDGGDDDRGGDDGGSSDDVYELYGGRQQRYRVLAVGRQRLSPWLRTMTNRFGIDAAIQAPRTELLLPQSGCNQAYLFHHSFLPVGLLVHHVIRRHMVLIRHHMAHVVFVVFATLTLRHHLFIGRFTAVEFCIS